MGRVCRETEAVVGSGSDICPSYRVPIQPQSYGDPLLLQFLPGHRP